MIDAVVDKTKHSFNITDNQQITIGANSRLTLVNSKCLANNNIPVKLSKDSYAVMNQSHQFLKSYIDRRVPVYGINTHFGDQVNLLEPHLKSDEQSYYQAIQARQENLIRSHACGLGKIIPPEIIKVTMMLRAHCLSQGYSGVAPDHIEKILNFLNAGIVPIVRCYGSIGASGDLIPLAMIAAAVVGEDVEVLYQDKIMRAPQAIAMAGLKPFKLQMRDGLSMINGTSFMTAIASVALYDLKRLFLQMISAIAMTLESMMIISSGYHPLVHQVKHHVGQMRVNEIILSFWENSQLLFNLDELRIANADQHSATGNSNSELRPVQDYYSLRAISQGFGPFYENLDRATVWVENEMNSVNDNPIIDAVGKQIHQGANFMGYYITDACDILKNEYCAGIHLVTCVARKHGASAQK